MRTFDIEYRAVPNSPTPDRTIRVRAEFADDAWEVAKDHLRETEWQVSLCPIYND